MNENGVILHHVPPLPYRFNPGRFNVKLARLIEKSAHAD
jgi:hypothetical protein